MNNKFGILGLIVTNLLATNAIGDAALWESRKAIQQNHNANMQGFQQFSQSLFNGMNAGSSVAPPSGGMMMQPAPPRFPAYAAITIYTVALANDMSAASRRAIELEWQNMAIASGGNNEHMALKLFNKARQLASSNKNENERKALLYFLSSVVIKGEEPPQAVQALKFLIDGLDEDGKTWHRTGDFGRILSLSGL